MAQAGRSSKISCAVWSPSLYPHTTTGIRNWRLARRTWSAVRQTRQSARAVFLQDLFDPQGILVVFKSNDYCLHSLHPHGLIRSVSQ